MPHARHLEVLALAAVLFAGGCGDDDGVPSDGGPTGMDAARGDGAVVATDGSITDAGPGVVMLTDGGVLCGTSPCACSNSIDDDMDGLADGLDPECTGPADNDEASFGTGIPGDNRDPFCQDCFFDGNSGAGDDHCRYATECLTGGTPTRPGCGMDCTVSMECLDFCRARTPNGCDCFGCCTVADASGATVDILIGGACSEATLSDPTICPRCTKATDCTNTCGRCELCPGRTIADLPADCYPDGGVDGGVPYTCDMGEQVCDAATPCPAGYYCQFGCCILGIF